MYIRFFRQDCLFGQQTSHFFEKPRACGGEITPFQPPLGPTTTADYFNAKSGHVLRWARRDTLGLPSFSALPITQEWENPRQEMVRLAYTTDLIFSISFRPRHPMQYQVLYLRSTKCSEPNHIRCIISQKEEMEDSHLPPQNPNRIVGFLKPYSTYCSRKFAPDDSFDQIPPKKPEECDFSDVEPPELRNTLSEIFSSFEDDYEAEEMALIYFQPQDSVNSVRKLRVKKAPLE